MQLNTIKEQSINHQNWIPSDYWVNSAFEKNINNEVVQFPDWDINKQSNDQFLGVEEFITGNELEQLLLTQQGIEIKEGIQHNHISKANNPWYKFNLEDIGELYTPQKSIRYNISWEDLYELGLVFGLKDKNNPTILVIKDQAYQVRLLKGINQFYSTFDNTSFDNSVSTIGSEWNRIHKLLTVNNTNFKNEKPTTKGEFIWCQEIIDNQSENYKFAISRNNSHPNHCESDPINLKNFSQGWKPVLQKI